MLVRDGGTSLWLWCPACEDAHRISIRLPDAWTWNENPDCPTIDPSIAVTGAQWPPDSSFYKPRHKVATGEKTYCHSFVRDGQWQFLADCTHDLAGQTVPLVPIPEWLEKQ